MMGWPPRFYWQLMKPRPTLLACLAAAWGYYMGSAFQLDINRLLHTSFGCLLVGGGAAAFNQYLEREHDKLMKRTEARPLPSGAVRPRSAFLFAWLLSVSGVVYLFIFAGWVSSLIALIMHACYTLAYTPLKRTTSLSAYVGAVAGALPPVLGWAGTPGGLSEGAWILFWILFFWQFPHISAIAWLYRDDYRRGGMRTLATGDPDGTKTSRYIILSSLLMLLSSLLPYTFGLAGPIYLVTASALGASFFVFAAFMTPARLGSLSRKFIVASVVYLPALIAVMILDKN